MDSLIAAAARPLAAGDPLGRIEAGRPADCAEIRVRQAALPYSRADGHRPALSPVPVRVRVVTYRSLSTHPLDRFTK
jgi:hypothetical protein